MAAHYDNQKVALLLLEKGASPHATAKVSARLRERLAAGGGPARCHLFPGGGEGTGHRRQAALRARPEVWGIVGSMERNEIIPRARGLRGGLGGGRCGEWASGGAV